MQAINNVSNYLRENGIRPSVQRIEIFSFIKDSKHHPTADNIYMALESEIPTLSKTTVYNTLHLFEKHGIVHPVKIDGNETRYDWDVSFHGHFQCTKCGNIMDYHFDENMIQIADLKQHQISESHLYFRGICKDCLNQ